MMDRNIGRAVSAESGLHNKGIILASEVLKCAGAEGAPIGGVLRVCVCRISCPFSECFFASI